MKSPFPGMDPYIEACGLWEDYHDDLIADIKRTLAATLPPRYVARTRKRSYVVLVESEGKTEHAFVPDVSVTAPPPRKSGAAKENAISAAATATEIESVEMQAFIETEFVETFIDIYELKPERRLVTSIEVLSPANKKRRSLGWKKYLRKRQALLLGKANLVEIDLLRGGHKMPMLTAWPKSPYSLLVAREEKAPRCRVWPAFFDRPLPTIPVPLSRPDPDIPLALQPLVDAIYERGRYQEEIDYTLPLTPPLNPEEAAWLKRQLRTGSTAAQPKPARTRRDRRQ
jgi:hypothetical protein